MGERQPSADKISARLGSRARRVEINGNQVYFEAMGQGQPLFFLHDGLVHRAGFDRHFEAFADRYTVIRYDRPGYGDSPPPGVPFSQVAILEGLFERLGLPPAVLVGGSGGGGIAIDFTLAHPKRVSGLVLVGAPVSGYPFSDHMWYRGWKNEWDETPAGMREFWLKDPWLIAADNTAAKARFRELLTEYPHNLEQPAVEVLDDGPAVDRLEEIRIPALVLIGEGDIADNHAHAGVIQRGISGAERVVVPNAGHLVYIERPEEFNRLVADFLERHGISSNLSNHTR